MSKTFEEIKNEIKKQNQETFGSYYMGDRPDSDSRIVYTVNRDSGILQKSNFETFKEILKSQNIDFNVHQTDHYLCGWVDYLVVPVIDLEKQEILTSESVVQDVFSRLENYPILNEDLYSKLEYESHREAVKDCLDQLEGQTHFLKEDTDYEVRSHSHESKYDCMKCGKSYLICTDEDDSHLEVRDTLHESFTDNDVDYNCVEAIIVNNDLTDQAEQSLEKLYDLLKEDGHMRILISDIRELIEYNRFSERI